MSKLLHKHETNFTVVPNEILQSKELKFKDIGLLCYLLSLPEEWEFSIEGLSAVAAKDGIASIRSGLENLKNLGYVRCTRTRTDDGRLSNAVWEISDKPVFGNQTLGNQIYENQGQIKKEYKKEKINKERDTRYAVSEEHSDLELVQVEGGYYAWRRKQ